MGVLINNLAATVPGFNVSVSSTWEQNKCSYEVLFTDTSTPTVNGYNNVVVEYFLDSKKLTSSEESQTSAYEFKEESNYEVRQLYTIYKIDPDTPNSREEILFQADNTFTVVVDEWKPFFDFPVTQNCYVRGEIDITPSIVELNNNVCGILPEPDTGYLVSDPSVATPGTYSSDYYANFNAGFQTLVYKLYKYDVSLAKFIEIGDAEQTFTVTNTTVSDYVFNYETQVLGAYKVVGTLSNCCMSVSAEKIFSTCDTIKIEPTCLGDLNCDDCAGYTITNETLEDTVITVTDQITGKDIHEFTVGSLSSTTFTPTQDGVYKFSWSDTNMVFVHSCEIDKCYHNLLRLILCRASTGTCCDDSFLESRLANVQAIWQTYQRVIEAYVDLDVRYTSEAVSELATDFQEIGKLQTQLLEFCDVCKRNCAGCFEGKSGTCI